MAKSACAKVLDGFRKLPEGERQRAVSILLRTPEVTALITDSLIDALLIGGYDSISHVSGNIFIVSKNRYSNFIAEFDNISKTFVVKSPKFFNLEKTPNKGLYRCVQEQDDKLLVGLAVLKDGEFQWKVEPGKFDEFELLGDRNIKVSLLRIGDNSDLPGGGKFYKKSLIGLLYIDDNGDIRQVLPLDNREIDYDEILQRFTILKPGQRPFVILPNGTVDMDEEEVRELFDSMGFNGELTQEEIEALTRE